MKSQRPRPTPPRPTPPADPAGAAPFFPEGDYRHHTSEKYKDFLPVDEPSPAPEPGQRPGAGDGGGSGGVRPDKSSGR